MTTPVLVLPTQPEPSDLPPTVQTPATARRRLVCMAYESIVLLAILFITTLPVVALLQDATHGLKRNLLQGYVLAVIGFYFVWCWTHGGQTLAMKTWRLWLVTPSGQPVTLPRALSRLLWAMLFFVPAATALVLLSKYRIHAPWAIWTVLPLMADLLWAFYDNERCFLHDRLAGTRLVKRLPVKPTA